MDKKMRRKPSEQIASMHPYISSTNLHDQLPVLLFRYGMEEIGQFAHDRANHLQSIQTNLVFI
jgi:hypothetical protein